MRQLGHVEPAERIYHDVLEQSLETSMQTEGLPRLYFRAESLHGLAFCHLAQEVIE